LTPQPDKEVAVPNFPNITNPGTYTAQPVCIFFGEKRPAPLVIELNSPDGNPFRIIGAVTRRMVERDLADLIPVVRSAYVHGGLNRLIELGGLLGNVEFVRDGAPVEP
jgi:hypothetical protein